MSTDDPTAAAAQPAAPAPTGPPWTVDLLADLHAGLYPPEIAGPQRRLVADDPWANSVLTALDATVDQLSLLPAPRMPERFALRLDAAIAAEYQLAAGAATGAAASAISTAAPAADRLVPQPRQGLDQSVSARGLREQHGAPPSPPRRQPPAPPLPPPPSVTGPAVPGASAFGTSVPAPSPPASSPPAPSFSPQPVASLDAARTRRRRWIGGLAAAAAIIGIGTATVASIQHSGNTGGLAGAPSSSPAQGVAPAPGEGSGNTNALQLDPGRIGDALQQIEGRRPVGSLQDAATYARCLAANAIDPSAVKGVTAASFEGRPAVAIAVVIDAGHSRVVVVGPGCGVNGAADQLAAQTVTR